MMGGMRRICAEIGERLTLLAWGFTCLLAGTRSMERRCKRDKRIRRLCTFRPEKTNDGLIVIMLWSNWYLATALMPLSISLRGWHRVRLGRFEHLLLHERFHYSLGQGYACMKLLLRPGLSKCNEISYFKKSTTQFRWT